MASLDETYALLDQIGMRRLAGEITPQQFLREVLAAFGKLSRALQLHYRDPPDGQASVPVILGGVSRNAGRPAWTPQSRLSSAQIQGLLREAIAQGLADGTVTRDELFGVADGLLGALPPQDAAGIRAWSRAQLAAEN